ncbi:MAG: glutathione-disulfide reductase [Rhodospirillales bacterium]|jgi:glutathione reductase (NADPH)|nr:glutathione-disulfide reductase [Rhodospirillales bacterium]
MPKFDFDLITLGAGSGGVRASRLAGGLGARVAVVEQGRVGGTCVMRGCVPKKLLVYGAHFAEDFADARGYGWTLGDAAFDWSSLITAKNRELARLEAIYRRILRDSKVELLTGRGALLDPHTVEVDGKAYTAERVLLATGGRPSLPKIPGIEHAITSDEALDLPELPRRVVIVGGGYIAVEFAGIFHALGAEVIIVIRAANLLRGFDEDVCEALAKTMEAKGISICRETVVRSIEKAGGGYSLVLSGSEVVEADLVMYATGRHPNTAGLGLEEAGVKLNDRKAVVVDEWSRSSVSGIFAVGDCTDRMNLTPVAITEAHAFVETEFNGHPMPMTYDNIPSAVFSQPPIGTVGLSEAEARVRGPIDVYVSRFKPMKHTLTGRDESVMMKLVVDRASDRVLGCHMVGADAPEIVQGLAVALKCGATKGQFDSTVGIHPTSAEEFVTMRTRRPDPDG